MAPPLVNRRKRDGALYTRPGAIEAALDTALAATRQEVLDRLVIRDRRDDGYLPSECLVHLLRASRGDNAADFFLALYDQLIRRIESVMPRHEGRSAEGDLSIDARLEKMREFVLQSFQDWVLEDRLRPDVPLDIFECKFDFAVAKLRDHAWRRVYREDGHRHSKTVEMLEKSIDSGEREFVGLRERFFSDPASRILLRAAIGRIPDDDKRRTIQMLIDEVPIGPSASVAMTICGVLDCDPKTVANRRTEFVAMMREILASGDGK